MPQTNFIFKTLQTSFNEYSIEAHRDLRRQAKEYGWVCVNVRNLKSLWTKPVQTWFAEHNIVPLNLTSTYTELWFDNPDEASLFILTWG